MSNEDDIVSVTLKPSGLDVGKYHNKLKFINNYDFGLISDDDGGTTEREIDIQLVPENIASPTNFNAELFGSTIVELTWNYPDSEQFIDLVKGYRIYQSTDQTNWESIVVLNDVEIVSYKIPNLLTDTTYYFQIDAYTDDVSSETVNTSIYIPKIEPKGDGEPNIEGSWVTNWGQNAESYSTLLNISKESNNKYIGIYSERGDESKISGEFKDNILTGFWMENYSDIKCEEPINGKYYWGRFSFTFSKDRNSFSGNWNYCEKDDLPYIWNGFLVR
jgi:hypothetical protein